MIEECIDHYGLDYNSGNIKEWINYESFKNIIITWSNTNIKTIIVTRIYLKNFVYFFSVLTVKKQCPFKKHE